MYEAFFALAQQPFGLTPNTEFFLQLPSHRDALQMLKVTIDNAEGFIKIVGEVGGWYTTMDTVQFWLIHVASAAVGLVAFALFKFVLAHKLLGEEKPVHA